MTEPIETAARAGAVENRWRKKPVEVEARQYCDCHPEAITEWSGARFIEITTDERDPDDPNEYVKETVLVIRTLEGDMIVSPGDWVIRGVQGEFYPCKPDIFEATYEPVRSRPVVASSRDGGPVDDEAPTLAQRQARYLAVRQHTLSTDGMDYDEAIVAQAEYVLGEAAELFVAVKRQEVNTFTPGQTAWHTRHEIADVVLATVTLANLLGVTVEDCIDEKTEADRGRG